MSGRTLLNPIPSQLRVEMNMKLGDRELAALNYEARFVVRRLVEQSYAVGYDDGMRAGMDDARVDNQIDRDREGNTQ